jgi:transcription elongation factor Elf1
MENKMAFATKQKLTCPNCKATKIVVFGDVLGAKEFTARICKKCNVSMKSEMYGIGANLTLSERISNMF